MGFVSGGDYTLTLVLYGDNVIENDDGDGLSVARGDMKIISGEEDASLQVSGGISRDEIPGVGVLYTVGVGIYVPSGKLTIAANHVTVKAGSGSTYESSIYFSGYPAVSVNEMLITGDHVHISGPAWEDSRGTGPSAMWDVGVKISETKLEISGDDVVITGGVINGQEAPAISNAERVVNILGTEERPLIAEMGADWTALEGSPFSATTNVDDQLQDTHRLRVRTVKQDPAPTPEVPAPAVPVTGDGADLALWLAAMTLTLAAVLLLRRARRA